MWSPGEFVLKPGPSPKYVPEAPTVTTKEVLAPQGLLEETRLGGSALASLLRGNTDAAEAAHVPLEHSFSF